MRTMVTLSLLLNLGVLIPVCAGLLRDAPWAREAYGDPSPARDILLAVYVAIGLLSAALLAVQDLKLITAVLALQVTYKLLTALTVGSLAHPVVASNIGIAIFHAVTLTLIVSSPSGPFR
ncbi:MAG: hypothetical protein AAFX50_06365 [Acidobacteriota bacterium]